MKKKVTAFDATIATVYVIFMVWLIGSIASNINSDILNPIEKTLSDFKLTDVYFSRIKESPPACPEIVMVNIGNLPREGISDLLNVLNKYDPMVVGIDAFFRSHKGPQTDSVLATAFSRTKNLVLVSELLENQEAGTIDSISYSLPEFMQYAYPGFADMITKGENYFKVVRECIPKEIYQNDTVYSFPVELIRIFNPKAAEKFIARNNDFEDINFQGNIITHIAGATVNAKNVFSVLDWDQVLGEHFEPEAIKNKIVIMGFMGNKLGDPSWEDKFFTPLNENYIGKTNPDMFGVVVHANIAAMILRHDFINVMPKYMDYILSIIFIFLNTWLFGSMFGKLEEWWDGANILTTMLLVVVLPIISVAIFHLYSYKFDITFPMIALFLMGNLIEIYFGLIKPAVIKLFNKRNVSLPSNEPAEQKASDKSEKTPVNYEI